MKSRSKFKLLSSLVSLFIGSLLLLSACSTTNKTVANESGAQLWSQKCQSCHNAPPPNQFSPQQWDVVIYHMKIKANLTKPEMDKIVTFLKQR
ncbi:MAG TPA: hypothetical protein VJ991_06755 [Balneolales bacterium]|nr:hypothetical protein [Balneolales bacterium]